MSSLCPRFRHAQGALVRAAVALLLVGSASPAQVAVDDIADPKAAKAVDGIPEIGEIPDGTPEELMAFIDEVRTRNFRPASRQQAMEFFKQVAGTSVKVADKILDQVEVDDDFHGKAAKLKLESLTMLGQLGDQEAAGAAAEYAETLVDSADKDLAAEANQIVIVGQARKIFSAGDVPGAAKLVEKVAGMLAASPDDGRVAMLAMQLSGALEHMPGAEQVALASYETFGKAFASSGDPQIKAMGESFAGKLRRLSLPGNEMEISGTNLDGSAFDQKTLAGKVVLVDFWATWCGPCVAELPNVLAAWDKYHDRGFEVVGISLDQDRDALEGFLKEREIPWTILHEEPKGEGWQHPLATYYGITGIPTVILVGRDGKVITMDVRGEKLEEELSKLFQ